jgi:hypothetical protein
MIQYRKNTYSSGMVIESNVRLLPLAKTHSNEHRNNKPTRRRDLILDFLIKTCLQQTSTMWL